MAVLIEVPQAEASRTEENSDQTDAFKKETPAPDRSAAIQS